MSLIKVNFKGYTIDIVDNFVEGKAMVRCVELMYYKEYMYRKYERMDHYAQRIEDDIDTHIKRMDLTKGFTWNTPKNINPVSELRIPYYTSDFKWYKDKNQT